jgi:hypothetical protein
MGLGIDIGIDAQRDARPMSYFGCDIVNRPQFRGRFDVEHQDIRLKCVADFPATLADSRKHNLGGRHSSFYRPIELAAGDDIGSAPFFGHQAQNRQIGIGLHRVCDDMGNVLKRVVKRTEMPNQRSRAVDIARRADFLGDSR